MNRATIAICLFLIFFSLRASSQLKVNQVKNTIHFDVASAYVIGMYSINYERLIYPWHRMKIYVKAGYGGWYRMNTGVFTNVIDGKSATLNTIFLIGGRNHHFETSLGARYVFFDEDWEKEYKSLYPDLNFGYRFQKHDGKGILFRLFAGTTGIGIGLGKAF